MKRMLWPVMSSKSAIALLRSAMLRSGGRSCSHRALPHMPTSVSLMRAFASMPIMTRFRRRPRSKLDNSVTWCWYSSLEWLIVEGKWHETIWIFRSRSNKTEIDRALGELQREVILLLRLDVLRELVEKE